ncbi:Lamin Tail domain protein [Nannochloropsis gaditana]|uniref:Lamin Tail domain protein n=1 Tax=Nannochloropsis gaditana TaxID=72520 RepID=W7TNN4_9STRA|nr:Lamin Tail domain protein [Nannochloropsis gaditana]
MRRLIEIPWLDECDQDGTSARCQNPRRRSILYRSPPYISDVDVKREIITISNPESVPVDLSGHSLCDKGQHHRYEFEEGYTLAPGAELHVYCAPGKYGVEEEERPGELQILLWTTREGRPRRREVLNQEGDRVTLIDQNGMEIAALEVTVNGDDEEEEGEREKRGTGKAERREEIKRLYLYRLEVLQLKYAKSVVTWLQGSRLALMVLAFIFVLLNDLHSYVLLEVGGFALDMAARYLDPVRLPRSRQRVFALVADRLDSASLLAVLMTGLVETGGPLYGPNPVHRVRLGLGMLLIEVLAFWFEVLVEGSTRLAAADAVAPYWRQGPAPAGEEEVSVQTGPYRKWLRQHLGRCPALITFATGGNHLFLVLAVVRLAHAQAGGSEGLVVRAVSVASRIMAYLPLPRAIVSNWQFLLIAVCLSAMYRCILIWAELLDLLESKL